MSLLAAHTALTGSVLGLVHDTVRPLNARKLVCTRAKKNASSPGEGESSGQEGKLNAGGLPSFLPFPTSKTTKQEPQQSSGTVRLQRPTPPGRNKAQQPEGLFASLPFAGFGFPKQGPKESQTVFVAGASGRLGIRIVHQLAAAGFRVRAGVRSEEKAERLLNQLDVLGETLGPLSRQDEARIKCVLFDLEDPETLVPALGSASRVVCAVGAADADFLDLSAPRRIDYEGTERLIDVAASRGVQQFVLITSLGTGKVGFPASALNLFGGVLSWKRKAEEALERSGMPYLIVRPGGMERPKDNYKDTHNAIAAARDTLFGGNVSRLQVAELVTAALLSPELAENKTLELVADTKAPLVEYDVILSQIPQEIAQETREEGLSTAAELRSELGKAEESLAFARQRLAQVRESIAELQSSVKEKRASAKQIQKEQMSVIDEASKTEKEIQRLRSVEQSAMLNSLVAKAISSEAQRAQREGVVLSRQELVALKENALRELTEATKRADSAEQSTKQAKKKVQDVAQDRDGRKQGAATEDKASKEGGFPSVVSFMEALSFAPKPPVEQNVVASEEPEMDVQGGRDTTGGFFSGISNFFQPEGTVYVDEVVASPSEVETVAESEPETKPKKASRTSIRAEKAARNAARERKSRTEPPFPEQSERSPETSTDEQQPEIQLPSFGGRFGEAFKAFSLPTLPAVPAAPEASLLAEEALEAQKAEQEKIDNAVVQAEAAEEKREEKSDVISQQQKDLENALNSMFSWLSPPQELRSDPPPAASTTSKAESEGSTVAPSSPPPVIEQPVENERVEAEAPSKSETGEQSNVEEAREWIAAWRRRQSS